jgi:hypothetical protein
LGKTDLMKDQEKRLIHLSSSTQTALPPTACVARRREAKLKPPFGRHGRIFRVPSHCYPVEGLFALSRIIVGGWHPAAARSSLLRPPVEP